MSITYVVDSRIRLVRSTYTGFVTLVDLVTYVKTLAAAGLLDHAMLIDARQATLLLTKRDTREFAEVMESLRAMFGRARVAFVPGNVTSQRTAERYVAMGAGSNPYQVFEDVSAAEGWLVAGGGEV
jgi:hypothetical protein